MPEKRAALLIEDHTFAVLAIAAARRGLLVDELLRVMAEEGGLEKELRVEDLVIEIVVMHRTRSMERHQHSWPRYNNVHVHKREHRERAGWRVRTKDGIVLGSGGAGDEEGARERAKELVRKIVGVGKAA